MYNRPDYRIRGQRKTQDDFDDQFEQELKLSNHLKSQRRQSSAVGFKKLQESAQNSRIVDTRTNSGLGSMVGSRVGRVLRMSKVEKNTVTDIQFNNVRWISIVSAYDSKRLRHVTVSKQSCEAFLKKYGNGVKKDPAAIAYFKDIKRHFHSWLAKINEAYSMVLGQFLTVSQKPPLRSLQQIGPTLEQIRADTAMMRQKLEGCLKIYENSDFRKLSDKFQQFFSFSRGLEQVIGIIFESKQKIDQLFVELQEINNMDRKVQKIRKKGIKQAKRLVYNDGDYNSSLCQRIMDKVIISINDMATRSLDIFGQIQGARHLLSRLQQLLNDSKKKGLTISEIQKLSQIFKEIMEEANVFQKFAEHFGESDQLISTELRQKIKQYQQDLEDQKKAVSEIQVLFVGNVIKQTIEVLKRNFSINDSLAQSKIQYQEYNHLLQEISEAMLDQTRKASVQGLIKFEKTAFSRLDENFDKIRRALRRNSDGLTIDSEEGHITVDCYVKETKDYKDKVRNLIKRNEEALRSLDANNKEVRLPVNDKDAEIIFLMKLSGIVEVVNGRERKHKLNTEKGFQQVNGNIVAISEEAEKAYYLIQQLEQSKIQIKQMNDKNPLPNLIKFIYLDNSIYLESTYLISVYETCCNTTESNLIQQLSNLNKLFYQRKQELEKQSHYHITKYYQNLLDRMYCFILFKGLKKTAIKELDNVNNIVFPTNQYQTKQMENQIKYRGLIADNLGEGCILAKKKIKQSGKVMKDFVGAYRVIQKLVTNEQGQYFIQVKQIADLTSKMFHHSILSEHQERVTECRKVSLDLVKSLKNKLSNIQLLDREIDIETHEAALKVRKQILHYQTLNEKTLKIAEELTKSYNSQPLEMLSSFVYSLSEYIMESKQISYLALNQFKQPIWIGLPQQSEQGLIAQVNLKGYNRGNYVQSYVRQAPNVKSVEQKLKAKAYEQPIKKSQKGSPNIKIKVQTHPQQDMDEEIPVYSDQQELIEMGDEVQEEEQPQDMIEQFDDNIEEGIADQMVQDFEEGNDNVQQDKMSEEIEDIEDSRRKHKNASPKHQKEEDKKAPQIQKQSIKSQKQKKYAKPVYEVIPHFKDLTQIRNLFSLINSAQFKFWQNQVDFEEISDYFHRQKQSKGRSNFIKSLENSFNLYLNQIFGNVQSEQMKKLQIFTVLKNNFSHLGDKNWTILFKVLQLLELNYSLLYNKEDKNEILQIFIANKNESQFKKEAHKKCITNYLQRTFKSIYYLPALFDIQSYISFCFNIESQQLTKANGLSFHYIVKFTNKYAQALPTANTHQELKSLEEIQTQFTDNFVTGIDAYHLCLQMWLKTVDSFASHYSPDFTVLKNYMSKLSQIDKKEWIGHYLTEYAKQTNSVCQKIKNCHNTLVKILFKADSSNIHKCIDQTAAIFKQTINREVYLIGQNKKEELIFFSTSEKVNAKCEQSALSSIIQRCLWRKEVKDAKVVIRISDIIPYVEGLFSEGAANAKSMSEISSFLNILQIEHFFILEPQFIISDQLQNLIHRILFHLKLKNTEDLMYNQILSDCFSLTRQNYCNEVKLNKNIQEDLFSQKYISKLFKQTATIEDELTKSYKQFEKTIASNNFSTLFFNKLAQIQQQQQIQIQLKARIQWLSAKYQQISIQLLNKTLNPLLYVRSQRQKIQSLNTIADQQLKQIKIMQLPFKDSNKHKQIQSYSKKLQQIKTWLQKKGLATVFTCYYVSFDHKNQLIGFDLNNNCTDKSIAKSFLFQIVGKYWLSRSNIPQKEKERTFQFLYTQFIEKHIIINEKPFEVQIIFHFQQISRSLQSSIRLDLAEAEDIISFSKNYNIHRFASNHENPAILEKLVQFHSNIIKRLVLKRNLLKMKQLVIDCSWTGLQKLEMSKQLLGCIKQQIDIEGEELDELINITGLIKLKQTDVAGFSEWYKRLAVKKMGFNYYQIVSSEDQLITILPVIKIEKDKSKNTNEIHSMLSDIRLPHKYNVQLKDGISILNLNDEIITCKIVDQQNYLTQDKQLSSFQPDVPESQILLLAYYQVSDREDSIPLYIGEIQLDTDCNLTINQNNTVVEIYCAVWKIGKQDYQNYKKKYERDTKQSLIELKKKIRGAASMIQKIKDVSIGQTLNFIEVGTWLREQLKKHNFKIQQQKRKQEERKRQQEILIKQAEDFLKQIHESIKKQQDYLPIIQLSIQELKKIHNDKQNIDGELTTYCKKIMKRTKKLIEKIQQAKSQEKMGRLSTISKDYIMNLQTKLIKVSSLEKKIVDQATKMFNEKKVQKERIAQEKKKKQLEIIALKEAEEQKKKIELQKEKAANNIQVVPGNSNPINIPIQSAKSNDIPIRSQEQELPDMRQVSKIQGIGKKQEQKKLPEEQSTPIVDLILENKQLNQLSNNQQQYEFYLLQLLQNQQLEDMDFCKSLLEAFWAMPVQIQQEIVLLR